MLSLGLCTPLTFELLKLLTKLSLLLLVDPATPPIIEGMSCANEDKQLPRVIASKVKVSFTFFMVDLFFHWVVIFGLFVSLFYAGCVNDPLLKVGMKRDPSPSLTGKSP